MYVSAQNAVFGWTMGITHHLHGVDNVQMIANLALLRGMVGRPHAGLLPIRGHSNVQGIGSVGVDARAEAGDPRPPRKASRRARCRHSQGLDTMGCMEAAGRGEMDTAVCLGGNLFGSNPDATFASQALGRLRVGRLPDDDAQHRPRLGHREGDAGPAGAAARRRAAADDAGVDVQLRPPERRRPAATRSAAQRSVGAVRRWRSACSARRAQSTGPSSRAISEIRAADRRR